MSVYDYIELFTDASSIIFSLFDLRTTEPIPLETRDASNAYEFDYYELQCSGYSDYEVLSVDLFVKDGEIHCEINIETDEEDEDE